MARRKKKKPYKFGPNHRIGGPLDKSNAKFLIICVNCQNEWTKIDMVRRGDGLPGIAVRIRCEHCGQTLELRRPIRKAKS